MAEASRAHDIDPLNILFLGLANELNEDDVNVMKNLLRGKQVLRQDMDRLRTAQEVFNHLKDRGDISNKRLGLLVQLFEQMEKGPLKERVREFQREHSAKTDKQKQPTPLVKPVPAKLDGPNPKPCVTNNPSGKRTRQGEMPFKDQKDQTKHAMPTKSAQHEMMRSAQHEMMGTKGKRKETQQTIAGGWSKFILDGQGPSPGQKFNTPHGLTFHDDKLLVCDKGKHIVQILNQDYTCEKVLGSFRVQCAKPFKPRSVAVSKDNKYFILDDNNLQIVVCNQNNKVIRIIPLPADINPWCIALLKRFVLVTDVNCHRLLKYTKTGRYVSEIGSLGAGRRQFQYPYFVAVNSMDVIMVSDCWNHCIKCFDSDFKFLYKYGEKGQGDSQLYCPDSIAVDGDDNVYVCDWGNHRISMWRRDGKWICNLFKHKVSLPWYIAVSRDRICVRGLNAKHIEVFSKKTETPR